MDEKIISQIKTGAKVEVHEKVKEGDKERIMIFKGVVIARKHGNEAGAAFTVRSTVAGVGVEKIFPIHSPQLVKIKISQPVKKVHKSKMYYIRHLSNKKVRAVIG